LQEVIELFGFKLGGNKPSPDSDEPKQEESKSYKVPEDRAIGRPHMMGWLDLLGEDEELGVDGEDGKEETFEADKWEEVKV
jgi:hypothetical protein